jgi:NADH:ubiquinone oxidoreductase subunit 4 (subunit M)
MAETSQKEGDKREDGLGEGLTLAALTVLLLGLGVYPAPLIRLIQAMVMQLI